MIQQPVGVKLALSQKQGFPSNVVQVLHTRPGPNGPTVFQQKGQQFTAVSVQPLLTSQAVQINTNTAAQYARKPQEMTLVGPSGAFMASPISTQAFGQVVSIGQANVPGMPGLAQTLIGAPGVGMAAPPGPNAPPAVNSMANSRKPCNCTKSHCLKLYCECFAQGQLCQNCNCNNCMNNLAYEEERGRAIKMTLERNPTAFHPKIGRGEGERKHTKGCNCKRSGCLKNYCECYEAKISCSDLCRCLGCRNTEDSIERRSLMRLAAMGSLRSRQPNAFKKHLIKPPAEKLPHVFFTWETIEAAASCLLAQAEDAERRDLPPASQERIILEEFGRTLDRVVEATSKAQVRTGSAALVPSGSGLPDDMTIGSTRNPLSSVSHQLHHRPRGRHDDEDMVEDDEDDDFQDDGDSSRVGTYGPDADAGGGPFEDEDDDEDIDLLDRHNQHYHQRRRSTTVAGSEGASVSPGDSGSAKMPPVKFISRSGANRSYIPRKDFL
ncbi:unnamed protein product [Mesocestoides corti]|uniref:CRC domain-containing protein n=1 Tax=Mesocestoides corti TaxID=53468 RepID=A0A0R3UJA7_MESCO|nr:unnamed protein product [Mesocestoides corti]